MNTEKTTLMITDRSLAFSLRLVVCGFQEEVNTQLNGLLPKSLFKNLTGVERPYPHIVNNDSCQSGK